MNDEIGTGAVEDAGDLCADTTSTAGDERHFAREGLVGTHRGLEAGVGLHGVDYDAARESLNANRH